MKKAFRLIGFFSLGFSVATITGVICEVRRRNNMRMLLKAANEGYEVAPDIIYPDSYDVWRKNNLKYGPIHPEI